MKDETKVTLVSSPGGSWSNDEVFGLVNGLGVQACKSPCDGIHVILQGHHSEEEIKKYLPQGFGIPVFQTTGIENNPRLPFRPTFYRN
jgi:hypothetical protein